MNFVVNTQRLAVELRLLNKIVPPKPAIAVLSHVRFEASVGRIDMHATDLDHGLSASCDAEVTVPGTAVMPSARLLSLVERMPDADVTFTVAGTSVSIACGSFKSKIQTMSPNDYPTPPDVEGFKVTLDGASLCDMVRKVRYAINQVGQKHSIQGALLTLSGPAVTMVTTDGRRLVIAAAVREPGVDNSTIVPAKALDWLLNNAGSGQVEMTVGPKHCSFEVGSRTLNARLLSGQFPNYERIVPRDNNVQVTAGVAALSAALHRVLLVSEENQAVYAELGHGLMTLKAAASGVGSAEEDVQVGYDGSPLKVCLNGTYLLDFLEAAVNAEVTMAFKDAKGSMLVTDGASHVGVIMLMRA